MDMFKTVECAGVHLKIDVFKYNFHTISVEQQKLYFIEAVKATGATIENIAWKDFPGGLPSYSGTILLSESHASIHTFPERNYAAIDIFTCGKTDVWAFVAKYKRLMCMFDFQMRINQELRGVDLQ